MGAVDRERPRSRAPPSRKTAKLERHGSACPAAIRRSVTSAVKHSVPWSSRAEPKTPRDVHAVKAAERAGNARGTGGRIIMQVAEVGRTHRAPCPPEDRKVLWWQPSRALAGRKLASTA